MPIIFKFILLFIFRSCSIIGLDNPARCKTDLGFVFFKKREIEFILVIFMFIYNSPIFQKRVIYTLYIPVVGPPENLFLSGRGKGNFRLPSLNFAIDMHLAWTFPHILGWFLKMSGSYHKFADVSILIYDAVTLGIYGKMTYDAITRRDHVRFSSNCLSYGYWPSLKMKVLAVFVF